MRADDEAQRGSAAAGAAAGSTGSRGFPDRSLIDLSRDPTPGEPDHLAPDDSGDRPLVDLSRDPTPGVPDHAAPDDDEGDEDDRPAGSRSAGG